MEQINAGLLISGRGEPVRDATVLIDGERISYAGPAAGAPAAPGAVTRTAATVLPGCGTATATSWAAGRSTWRGCHRSPRPCARPGQPVT